MLRNRLKNNIVLDQTEGVFPDFNRKEFNQQAVDIYERVYDAIHKSNKATLAALLSIPLQDAVGHIWKDYPLQLPFEFHEKILKSKLRQGSLG